jgi:hypothetical protein
VLVVGQAARSVEGGALMVATAPVWVPWWLTKVRAERREAYARAYTDCLHETTPRAER